MKKTNVRVKKSFTESISKFAKDPNQPKLNNHPLKREYEGYRSINITSDWRALYKTRKEGEETVAYFILLGTHAQLYR